MKKLEALIIALNDLNEENKTANERYKNQKKTYEAKIQKEFEKAKVEDNSYSFERDDEILKATLVQPKKVTFNIEKLEERLDNEILNSIVKKQYRILDYPEMVEYLKSLGAKPKDFKKFICCEKEVDQKKIDELGDLGKISEEDIQDCCTVSPMTSYVKITRKEIEEDEE